MQAPRNYPPLRDGRPVRIIGQGLSGSLLALMLHERKIPFTVQDAALPGCATVVAPGIVNPLAGRSFRPPENLDELMEQLGRAMDLAQQRLGIRVWHPCPILRMFAEPTQVDRFEKGLTRYEREAYIGERFGENSFPHLNDVYGSFVTLGGGWADLPRLVTGTRDWLAAEGRLIDAPWTPPPAGAPVPEDDDGTLTLFCEGWQIANNPHWAFIPHNPAKGEMLIVRFDDLLPRDRIYNQSCWAQPIGEDLWRVGATYSWSDFNSVPSIEGALDLQERLRLLTPLTFHVVEQQAGVRAIVSDYHPVLGRHPQIPHWHVLNALGSKGVMQAPAAAAALIAHLCDGEPLPEEWAVDRFTGQRA